MAFFRRQFSGTVSYTDTLAGGINSSALSFTLTDGSTFPNGSVGPFVVTVDPGKSSEEKILCASRSGAVVTVQSGGRGYDGTTAVSHSSGGSVIHSISAVDLDEANQAVVATLGAIQGSGDLVIGSGANALSRLARGAANSFLQVVGTTLQWTGFGVSQTEAVAAANSDGTQTTPAHSDHAHAGVTSFNTRQGVVTPGNADYLAVPSGGLTGAVAATRYVGGTTSGAPASGTFAKGDFIVTQDGHIFVCTAAGTPGTWVDAGTIASAVSSVFGRTGAVRAGDADYLAVSAGGLTGATAGTRLVGGTTGGAPASGTFNTGDVVVDQDGYILICVGGGSPGAWRALPGGTLGYAQLTSNVTGITVQADIGLSQTVLVGTTRRIRVSFVCNAITGTNWADAYAVYIMEGATVLMSWSVLAGQGTSASVVLTPTAGSHTYKIQAAHLVGSTAGTLIAGTNAPAQLLIEDIGA